jgi:hypothetical protein
MTSANAYDVIVLGSGIAGLAGALAAHELGLRPVVLEKASTLGGGTVNSYGLIWIGQNHLAQAAGYADSRDETIAYMRFLGGGSLDENRMSSFVDRSPEALRFFETCGARFRVVRGVTDHYFGKSPGSHPVGRSVEVDLISGFDLGDWRERVLTPHDVPCFVTAEEQIAWGGINSFSRWDQDLVRERKRADTVLGYPDSAAVGIAMERGEVDGYCSFTWSAINSARPQWVAENLINVVLQLSLSKHPELSDVPLVMDLAKDEASRQIFALAFGTQKMGRPVAIPPGVPADRADALRQAFDATMADPEFLEDARRSVLEVDGPISGKEVEAILKQIYATPKDLVASFVAIRDEK